MPFPDPDETSRLEPVSRRRFLQGVGTIAATAVAVGEAPAATAAAAPPAVPLPALPPEGPPSLLLRMQADVRRALEKAVEQRRWVMAIDVRKCVGCSACTVACAVENKLPPGMFYRVVEEETAAKSLDEWAQLAGITAREIEELAREFTSHGKRAVADIHRGVSQHTNGFYQVFAWYTLNLLIGNYDWKGGLVKAATYDPTGGKRERDWAQPFPIGRTNGKLDPFGVSVIRHGVKYEETTLFAGYPAKRPWFPLASDVMIDGEVVKGDPRRGTGVHANAAIRVDPAIGNTTLSDLTGASAVFYDTSVTVTRA
jgi:ferredoxin